MSYVPVPTEDELPSRVHADQYAKELLRGARTRIVGQPGLPLGDALRQAWEGVYAFGVYQAAKARLCRAVGVKALYEIPTGRTEEALDKAIGGAG